MRKRENRKESDKVLLFAVLVIVALGILMVYSASSFRGEMKYGDSTQFLKSHALRVGAGLLLLLIFSRIPYRQWRWLVPLLLVTGIALLVFVLFLPPFHNSRRSILVMGNRFQPSEWMKLVTVLYLAAVYAKGRSSFAHQRNALLVHFGVLLAMVGLVFIEPDLGTALVIFLVGFSMFYLGGIRLRTLSKMGLAVIVLIALGMLIFPYQRGRVTDYLGSVTGRGPMSYQVEQAVTGLANGGPLGTGYGEGKTKLFYLPEPFSDFILASTGEELGFAGIVFLFAVMGVILFRGMRIAMRAPDRFGFLVAGGITAMIMINALVNAGVVLNLLPTTGLPFPFLSYGGSSILTNCAAVGILLSISRESLASYGEFTRERAYMHSRYGTETIMENPYVR